MDYSHPLEFGAFITPSAANPDVPVFGVGAALAVEDAEEVIRDGIAEIRATGVSGVPEVHVGKLDWAAYLQGREVFVQDLYAGADPEYRLPVRIVTQHAWHNLFAQNMFIRPAARDEPPPT